MGRPPDDVEVKREGPGKENDSVVAQRLGSTEIPFDLSQSSSFFSFSAGSPMIVCNTPADCSTTSASFSATNSIPLCTQDGNREHRLDFTVSPEYAKDIYDHLRRQEEKLSANPVYMRKQPDITHGMRAILVDWLVEVAEEYKLHSQTLYLAVSYIDRFLSKMSVLRNKLQLVGTASMLVAAKFEEIHPPEVDEFVYITDDTYTKKQVLKMEYLLLNVLKFDLASPTVVNFLQRYIAVIQANQKTEHLAMYFAELTLLDADPYLKYPPSVIAGAALALALHTLSLPAWTPALIDYSGYTMVNIQACLEDLQSTFIQAPRHPQQAVQEKYSQAKFSSVGRIPPPATLPI
jgi:cyclin A